MVTKIEDAQDPLLRDLKESAFEALLLNPGLELDGWCETLCRDYGSEVADVYGFDPEDIQTGITELWECEYCDPATNAVMTFAEWATVFENEDNKQVYYRLVKANRERQKSANHAQNHAH